MAGALVVLGVMFLSRPMTEVDLRRAPALRTVRTSVSSLTTPPAPDASAASPIRSAVALPGSAPASRPGRLDVEVTDEDLPVVIVTLEADGAAARSGLLAGDVIVSVNGEPIRHADDLAAALSSTGPGDLVTLAMERDGRILEATVVLD